MPISYKISKKRDRLIVETTGNDDSLEEVQAYGMQILKAAIENQSKTVLCDERALTYELDTIDTYSLGEAAAKLGQGISKIAIICNRRYLQDGKFYETVASNRGLRIMVTDNIKQAKDWLDK
ncbi:MAG: hypothetical protein JXQ87_06405 [Bacteroidia bacterium]